MKKLEFRNGTVSVDDIFASSWGYEQSNVGFYQVVSVHGSSTVCVRPVDSVDVYVNTQGYLIPIMGAFIGEDIFKRRVKDFASVPCISIDDCETAYKTTKDKKHRFTTYG